MSKIASVIILTYEDFRYVYELIDSVLKQDYSHIELIIADDSSPLFPEKEIRDYISLNMKHNILNSIVYSNDNNLGTVQNLNTAIRRSSGDYILSISSDDLLFCDSTITQIIEQLNKSETGMICCRRILCDENMNEIRFMPTKYHICIIERFKGKEEQHRAFALGMFYEMASGSSTFFTRTCLFSSGLYDERYCLLEDWPQFLMLTRKQKLEFHFDLIAVRYREGGLSSQKSPKLISDYKEMLMRELVDFKDKYGACDYRYIKYCLCRYAYRNTVFANFRYPISFIRKCLYKATCLLFDRLGEYEYHQWKRNQT